MVGLIPCCLARYMYANSTAYAYLDTRSSTVSAAGIFGVIKASLREIRDLVLDWSA